MDVDFQDMLLRHRIEVRGAESVAEIVHRLRSAHNVSEDLLYTRLSELFGGDKFEDITTDEYDNSLELIGAENGLKAGPEQEQAIYSMGFCRFWIRHLDETEEAYRNGK